jgi:xylan 1,4-beta-xylosidase
MVKKCLLFFFIPLFLNVVIDCQSISQEKKYNNPILAGFYPDPSICRVGDNYYLVNSTFSYFPGIPVFQSKDLVNWKQIGNAMNRSEQMDLSGLRVSEGMFAPAIRYNKDKFYITCTFVGGGGNFIISSKKPEGSYSNPVWIPQINGIDPSLFFDDDGKTYIIYNSIPPDDKPLYDGHRTIRMYQFDIENLKVTGNEFLLINGGVDISKKPVWIEGPHLFKKDGYYYLLAAEGGTSENHSVVIFRSKTITGDYEPFKENPILTQRHLDPKRINPITCTGHADLVQTQNGEWYSVFLGCRPYLPFEQNYYNTGRETFLVPLKWQDGWPKINPDFSEVQYSYAYPLKPSIKKGVIPQSGNFKVRDDFNKKSLDLNWVFLRTPKSRWYDFGKNKDCLSIQLRPETCSEKGNPSFIGRRQQHQYGYSGVKMLFNPAADNEKAGLMVFQNENHFYFLCKSLEGNIPIIQLFKSNDDAAFKDHLELIASQIISKDESTKNLFLKILSKGNVYSFLYSFDNIKWEILKENSDATFLSTRTAGGFVGCMYAMYATSLGKVSKNNACFDWFEYCGEDAVY